MPDHCVADKLGNIAHFIHGKRCDSPSEDRRPLFNPASGRVTGELACASEELVNHAVASSQEGQRLWAAYPVEERARILRKAACLLKERTAELARLEAQNTGKPISETESVDIPSSAECLFYFASAIETLRGASIDTPTALIYTRREPLGVCLGIGAWNYPLQIAAWKSAPALACGNSMVFKPAELTPFTAVSLAEIYCEAGVPPGVFNVVQGPGSVAELLIRHSGIAKVSLTGSVATGQRVMAAAGSQLKPVTLELGGKSPLIIFEDADFEQAVSAALLANFYSCGQVCTNGTRVFVHQTVYERFLAAALTRTRKIRLGAPLAESTQMGPLVSKEQYSRVRAYIAEGEAAGARKLCGGGNPFADDAVLSGGYFVEPVIFADCRDDMRLVQEEIFGPVMAVLPFANEDEVIERANQTSFGLAAGVCSQNISRAHRVAHQLAAGTCWINNYNWTPVAMPFGGYKNSGIGRENGLEAIEHYSQIKSVYVELSEVVSPF